MAITMRVSAQVSDNPATAAALKAGVSYVHDFPGLNGFGVHAEYGLPVTNWAQLEFGVKRIQAGGHPRTETVNEYTRSTTLDFNILFVPYSDDNSALKIGGGYSLVFYNLRRSYPVFANGSKEATGWPVQDSKGNTRGCSLIGEYEYYFSDNVSAGARVSLAKAYSGHVWMAGPYVAIKL